MSDTVLLLVMNRARPPLFERLKSAMEDLSLYAKGEKVLVEKRLSLPDPPRAYQAQDIASLRQKLGLSQAALAAVMHVSVKTIQGWEQIASSVRGFFPFPSGLGGARQFLERLSRAASS